MRQLFLVAAFAVVGAACTRGEPQTILEAGQPRFPDAEAVVTDISFERLVLDDGKSYAIHPEVESFTTRGHAITPLLTWTQRYVHVGLNDEGEVVWIAGIGVVPAGQEDGRVFYTGVFQEMQQGRAVFEDGTTLKLAEGSRPPSKGIEILARIDPDRDLVVEIQPAG